MRKRETQHFTPEETRNRIMKIAKEANMKLTNGVPPDFADRFDKKRNLVLKINYFMDFVERWNKIPKAEQREIIKMFTSREKDDLTAYLRQIEKTCAELRAMMF